MYLLERFRLFIGHQGLKIRSERDVQGGLQVVITNGRDTVSCTFYRTGRVLAQGRDCDLKSLLMAWAGSSTNEYRDGVGDLPAGWREWDENADWLQKFIEKYGEPDEDEASDDYRINREIMFHDYMFRNRQMSHISFETFRFVITSWLNRFCFMGHMPDEVVDDCLLRAQDLWTLDPINSLDLAQAADSIAYVLPDYCASKFVMGPDEPICPQRKANSDMCVVDLVDALYPYTTAGEVIAYTKTNMRKLINKDYKLKWYDLKPNTEIEKIMATGLKDAGILHVPQWQAFDDLHKYKIDFVVKTANGPNLAIECDGLEFHARPQNYIRDRIRDRYLSKRGFYLMRFSSVEIFNGLDQCLREIDQAFWYIQKGKLTLKDKPRNSYFGVNE